MGHQHEAVYHIFAYLANHPTGTIVFDATTPRLDESCFHHDADWKPFYGNIQEEQPRDMPHALGLPVAVACFVDANHAGNVLT
jgi:hypothetical protein